MSYDYSNSPEVFIEENQLHNWKKESFASCHFNLTNGILHHNYTV